MPTAAPQIAELQHAYQVLDIPLTSSARSIKKAHHRLVKRWHPDLYPAGSSAQAEATQMMKLINEAYALIADAPLSQTKPPRQWWNAGKEIRPDDSNPAYTYVPLNTKRIEYWVRFTYGIFFGFASVAFVCRVSENHLNLDAFSVFTFLIAGIVFTLLCGFVVAIFGEKWWR